MGNAGKYLLREASGMRTPIKFKFQNQRNTMTCLIYKNCSLLPDSDNFENKLRQTHRSTAKSTFEHWLIIQ